MSHKLAVMLNQKQKFFQWRAARFLVLYGIVIIYFASCYYSSGPSTLYAPYIHLEYASRLDTEKAEQRLVTLFGRQQARLSPYKAEILYSSGHALKITSLTIDSGNINSFILPIVVIYSDNIVHDCAYRVLINIHEAAYPFGSDLYMPLYNNTIMVPTTIEEIGFKNDVNYCHKLKDKMFVFKVSDINGNVAERQTALMTDEDLSYLLKYSLGEQGDPFYVSDFLSRVLYFSATTITTTGFGDIVPLSRWARMLTAIEAVFGWAIAGVFLNTLALDIRRSPERIGSVPQ